MIPEAHAPSRWAPTHPWLRTVRVAYAPGSTNPLLEDFAGRLLETLQSLGHLLHDAPIADTDAIITTAEFGVPHNWRQAKLFTARSVYRLPRTPGVFTLIHATPSELKRYMDHFTRVLPTNPPDPADYEFPGLLPRAYKTMFEQGQRGGPLLALARLLQSQSKSIRIILVVGETTPDYAYIFDLVGAHPKIDAGDPEHFYRDIALRMVTAMSTDEITNHQVLAPAITQETWASLKTPHAMRTAADRLGQRNFFTEMILISNLIHVPALSEAVASQYSEGCYATWEPEIDALIATITGSARPVEKDAITDNDLAVIVGVKPDGSGAQVRHVDGKINDPPSSESVEMMEMDAKLPRIFLPPAWEQAALVPVVRSKLHGHRGVGEYDPRKVEFVPLDLPYYHYPVSCATAAQASGIVAAFARSEALQNPHDPRQVIFTVLPGHGVVIAEKWVHGKQPFEIICDFMDQGELSIENLIPQGPMHYRATASGMRRLAEG